MRGSELLDRLELVDPAYIEAADIKPKSGNFRPMKWSIAAACFCLIAAVLTMPYLRSIPAPEPETDPKPGYESSAYPTSSTVYETQSEKPREPFTLIFNEAAAASVIDASRRYIPGYFTEELNAEELAALTPDRRNPDMVFSGHAGFNGEGTLIDIFLNVTAPFLDPPVSVRISHGEPSRCYELPAEPAVSTIDGTDFTVYQWSPDGENYRLEARADINGAYFQIEYETTADQLEQAKEDFTLILDCFSCYADGKPELSAITAEVIPEWFDNRLTHSEAVEDPAYGRYMLKNIPEGYAAESIRRYKDQNSDYLSGLWINGYDDLRWKVSYYTEADESRITRVEDRKNYDLSLYPIPRGESVPEELWEIVDNPIFRAEELTPEAVLARAYTVDEAGDSGGRRMAFSVKYGDILVEVRSKGIDPEWVYRQLRDMAEE